MSHSALLLVTQVMNLAAVSITGLARHRPGMLRAVPGTRRASPPLALACLHQGVRLGAGAVPSRDAAICRVWVRGVMPRSVSLVSGRQRQWWEDVQVLAELGRAFEGITMPAAEVRIPKHLAEQALAASTRNDDGPQVDESHEQQVCRHRAAALALIGHSIQERGKAVADAVVVDLGADLVAAAVNAAEDA